MTIQTKPKGFNRYLHYANLAVKREQADQYRQAAEYWEIAKLSATGANIGWCDYRYAYCIRMIAIVKERENDDR